MESNCDLYDVLVSVIIPTYKRCDTLTRAISSILSQTYQNIQIVVVDDNNPDTEWRRNTMKIMSSYKDDSRIKYVCHSTNLNGSAARNTGIKESDGLMITYLDDDDVYRPNKIEKQVCFLKTHPEFQAVYCGWQRDGNEIIPHGIGNLSFEILSGSNIIITNSIMMWKSIAISCGGWDKELKRHQEAAYLLNFFRYGGKIGRVPEILIDFDTSDRSNVSDPKINEEQINYLLYKNNDLIQECEKVRKKSSKRIFSRRYIGIIMPYVKKRQYFVACFKFFQYGFRFPVTFQKEVYNYIKWRLSSFHISQTR